MAIIPITKKEVGLLLQPFRSYYRALSFEMDASHVRDFAYYDRATGIMHVNGPLLPQAPVWAGYFICIAPYVTLKCVSSPIAMRWTCKTLFPTLFWVRVAAPNG